MVFFNRTCQGKPQLFLLLMLTLDQWHMLQGVTRQYHLINIPWSRTKCPLSISRKSAMECAAACLAATDFVCLASSFMDSTLPECALCDQHHALKPSDTEDTTVLQMPVKYRSKPNSVELSVPVINFYQSIVYITGVPLDDFGIVFHDPGCTDDLSSCNIDFYFYSYAYSGNVTLAKFFYGNVFDLQDIDAQGIFESERKFHMVVMMLYDGYVIIVDGLEFWRYPISQGTPASMKVVTQGLYHVTLAINDVL